jgi:chromosome segregation ATPase
MRRDRDDMRNHLEMHAADLDKLKRLVDKFKEL